MKGDYMQYKITIEVGKTVNGKFVRTSYKEEHYFRYSLGRAIESIIRHLTRKDEKEKEIYEEGFEDAKELYS
jgi:hypothetical protein